MQKILNVFVRAAGVDLASFFVDEIKYFLVEIGCLDDQNGFGRDFVPSFFQKSVVFDADRESITVVLKYLRPNIEPLI